MPSSGHQFAEAAKRTISLLQELERVAPQEHEPLVRDARRAFQSAMRAMNESTSAHYNVEISQSHIDQAVLYVQGILFRVEAPQAHKAGGEIIKILEGTIRQCVRDHVAGNLEGEMYGK